MEQDSSKDWEMPLSEEPGAARQYRDWRISQERLGLQGAIQEGCVVRQIRLTLRVDLAEAKVTMEEQATAG